MKNKKNWMFDVTVRKNGKGKDVYISREVVGKTEHEARREILTELLDRGHQVVRIDLKEEQLA